MSGKRDVLDESLKVVIDTNLFIRGLLKGKVTSPLIEAHRSLIFEGKSEIGPPKGKLSSSVCPDLLQKHPVGRFSSWAVA